MFMFKNFLNVTSWINEFANEWLEFILNSSFQLMIFTGLVVLLTVFFRKRSAQFLQGLWSLVLIKAVIPPAIDIPLRNQQEWLPEMVYPVLSLTVLNTNLASPQLSVKGYLLILWFLIVVSLLVYFVLKNVVFRLKISDSVPIDPKFIPADLLHYLQHKKIQILENPTISIPFTSGLIHHKIYLPENVKKRKSDQVNAILLHELAHIQRKDSWIGFIQHLIQIVFFFHPVIWITNRQINKFRERASDDFVLANSNSSPLAYSKLLLSFIDQSARPGIYSHVVNYFFQSGRTLKQRFQYLIHRKERIMLRLKISEKLFLVFVVFIAFGISILNIRCSETIDGPKDDKTSYIDNLKKVGPPSNMFQAYDIAPSPIGGFQAIQKNVHYPEIARRAGIEGQVVVFAQIDVDGNVTDTMVKTSLGENGCDEAAIEAIKKTKWQPAKRDGNPVKVWVSIPIIFKLKQSKIDDSQSPPPAPVEQEILQNIDEEMKFVAYDIGPEPIGGFRAIQRNLHYPEIAQRAGIEGKVIVHVLIDENGKAVDTKVLRSLGENGCDEAAIAAVKKTKWRPALRDGNPVKVWVSLPIIFKLSKDSKNLK